MIYDSTPCYEHHSHLVFAREPFKSLYVFQRLLTTLLLVPVWTLYYAVLPRSYRPRPSWSLKQIIFVNFTRRIYKVTEVAGVTWSTRNPESEPTPDELKETRFEWIDPLPKELRFGVVASEGDRVPFKRVGAFIWPKEPSSLRVSRPSSSKTSKKGSPQLPSFDFEPAENQGKGSTVKAQHVGLDRDIESDAADAHASTRVTPVVGIFMHGGGYTHMSAHEKARTSRIPRTLIKEQLCTEVYAVEYRLLQFAPFPAVVQDAAAVYAHVVKQHGDAAKIVLIGDSSGGNLVLALTRWIRDEGKLRMPDGLLLLSPSCDTSHAIPETYSSHIPRPNAHTDYLTDTVEPRAILQATFLGFKYYPPHHEIHSHSDLSERQKAIEEDRRLREVIHSEYVSAASPRVLQCWGHDVMQHDCLIQVVARDSGNAGNEGGEAAQTLAVPKASSLPSESSASLTSLTQTPYRKKCPFPTLFSSFPRTLVVIGDAERLVNEVRSLVKAMEKDRVDVECHWSKDAVHDLLIIPQGWWDEEVREDAWKVVRRWFGGF
ncbi:hypothetical protein ONZ45_g14961 [Pleurotus djamor]|nr:hypothetical protein ONZ45_g14961 [Pleurotus djamor]